VRRTVRVAVALVVGQALLCALIGYLTLGRSGAQPRGDHMAEPPLAPPVTATSSPAPTAAAPTSVSATATRKPKRRAGNDATPARTKPAPPPLPPGPVVAEPPPETLIAPSPVPSAATTITTAPSFGNPPLPPTVPPRYTVQDPVTVGDLCAPEWAFGRTSDDTLVRCLRTVRHAPRWKIV
jgi:hypothetical protein